MFFIGCASGAAIVTGNTRPPIDPSLVKIYPEVPQDCEVIGIVTASSDSGLTAQGDINYALAELKKQAAKMGANGIVIEAVGKNTSVYVSKNANNSINTIPISEHTLSGKAIYVLE